MATINPTDPGAEMKARAADYVKAYRRNSCKDKTCITCLTEIDMLAAFAAKEVARATQELEAWKESAIKLLPLQSWGIAMGLKLGEDIHRKVLPALLRVQKMDEALARAVEEERMACARAVCIHCNGTTLWGLDPKPAEYWDVAKAWRHSTDREDMWTICSASAIHERSQVKGEGL